MANLRIKLVKFSKYGSAGSTIVIDKDTALSLIKKGQAILSKDMVNDDLRTKALDEEQANGKPTKLRSHDNR